MLISVFITSSCFDETVLDDRDAYNAMMELLHGSVAVKGPSMFLFLFSSRTQQLLIRENIKQLRSKQNRDIVELTTTLLVDPEALFRRKVFKQLSPDMTEVEELCKAATLAQPDIVLCGTAAECQKIEKAIQNAVEVSELRHYRKTRASKLAAEYSDIKWMHTESDIKETFLRIMRFSNSPEVLLIDPFWGRNCAEYLGHNEWRAAKRESFFRQVGLLLSTIAEVGQHKLRGFRLVLLYPVPYKKIDKEGTRDAGPVPEPDQIRAMIAKAVRDCDSNQFCNLDKLDVVCKIDNRGRGQQKKLLLTSYFGVGKLCWRIDHHWQDCYETLTNDADTTPSMSPTSKEFRKTYEAIKDLEEVKKFEVRGRA